MEEVPRGGDKVGVWGPSHVTRRPGRCHSGINVPLWISVSTFLCTHRAPRGQATPLRLPLLLLLLRRRQSWLVRKKHFFDTLETFPKRRHLPERRVASRRRRAAARAPNRNSSVKFFEVCKSLTGDNINICREHVSVSLLPVG